MADDDRGCGAGNALHVVMLGHPEPAIAEALGVGRHVACIVEGRAWAAVLPHAHEVKDRKLGHATLHSVAHTSPQLGPSVIIWAWPHTF